MSIRLYLILVLAMVSVSSTSLVIRYVTAVPALTLAFWKIHAVPMQNALQVVTKLIVDVWSDTREIRLLVVL